MYQSVLKSILASLIPHCPKEILIEISNFINGIYPKLEDTCLNNYMKNDTVKRRESAWKSITKRLQDVLHPLIQVANTIQEPLLKIPESVTVNTCSSIASSAKGNPLDHAIKAYAQRYNKETDEKKNNRLQNNHLLFWPIPRDINFLQIKDADDVATISCNVRGINIPYAMIDSGSDSSILSENVAKHLGLKIDRKNIHRLNGVASKSHSLGTVADVPITINDGTNSNTVLDDFSVVPTEFDRNGKELSLFILGTPWQYRIGWEPIAKGEFRATCNGKTITIPLSVHKSQRNVFTVESDTELKKNI